MTDLTRTGSERPQQRRAVRVERRNGGLALFDRTGAPLGELNESAAALWELCDGQTTAEEMVEAVCAACHVDRSDADADVRRALEELYRAGLIQ